MNDEEVVYGKGRIEYFVIGVTVPRVLEDTRLVENYIQSAITKYNSLSIKERGVDYFDGVAYQPSFIIKKLNSLATKDNPESVRDSIRIIKIISDTLKNLKKDTEKVFAIRR